MNKATAQGTPRGTCSTTGPGAAAARTTDVLWTGGPAGLGHPLPSEPKLPLSVCAPSLAGALDPHEDVVAAPSDPSGVGKLSADLVLEPFERRLKHRRRVGQKGWLVAALHLVDKTIELRHAPTPRGGAATSGNVGAVAPGDDPAAVKVAVILAAGFGLRLHPKSNTPKPLTKVLGLTLAERVVCALHVAADIRRFIVCLGHDAGTIKAHFTGIAQRRGVVVEFAEARDWQRGNGASALAAKGHTGDAPFFLVMADHLFDPEIARRLARDPPAPGEMCLAVDRDKAGIFDLDDVTRVRIADDRIRAIAKGLEKWDAADTGIMLCTAGLFEGLEGAAAKGLHALSDGLSELAREGLARAVDVTGQAWLDVDTPEALCEAERRIMREQGGKTNDGPVSRHLNRPVSRWLTRYLVRAPVTPNQISLASWVLSCLAAALFAAGGYAALAAGGVIAQIASIMDGCDGEIARLKRIESDFGRWFDAILDRYADAFLLFGLTWHVFAATGTHVALAIGFAAIVGSYMNSYTADKYDGLMARRLHGASYFRLGRDVRVFVIFLGAVLNQPLFTLGVVALVMNVEVVRRVVICRRAPAA